MEPLTIYRASAGSGKTFRLTVEYIRRIVCNTSAANAYKEVLAVTFTNKATAEMKDRIIEALYAIAHNLSSGNDYLKAILKDEPELNETAIRIECGKALTAILHDYSHFRVETIDTFFQSVLRGLAHELGLAANLQTDLDSTAAISDAVDYMFDHLEHSPQLRQRVSHFIQTRINDTRSWNVERPIKKFSSHIFDSDYQAVADLISPLLADESFIKQYRKDMAQATATATDYVLNCIEQIEYELKAMGYTYSDFCYGSDIANHINKVHEGHYPKWSDRLSGFATSFETLLPKAKKKDAALSIAAERLSNLLKELKKQEENAVQKSLTEAIILHNLNELSLLEEIERYVHHITVGHGTFLLSNTPLLLARLIANGDTPFIYEKLGTQLTHVMLDEFQDTSRLQWHNFSTLLRDNMDRGGSTMVVGDVKQSIYRWRDGDWSLLHRLENEMRAYKPNIQELDTNYRSYSNIIKFNNTLYTNASIALGLEDVYQYKPQLTNKKCGGLIQIKYYPKPSKANSEESNTIKEQTLQQMCQTIALLHNVYNVPWQKMAILIRVNSEETAIASAFAKYLPDVPLVSAGVFCLSGSRAVRIIIDTLTCLHNPTNHTALACLRYACSETVHTPDQLLASEPDNSVINILLTQRETLLRKPLYELVTYIIDVLKLSQINGQGAYLLTFMDQLANWIARKNGSIGAFLEYYHSHIANVTVGGCEIDGVNIITIHKSKGLEWHSVFLPGINWSMEDNRETKWCSTGNAHPYNALPYILAHKSADMCRAIFKTDYEYMVRQQVIDALNLLYVATTRAVCNLYIWSTEDNKNSMSNVLYNSLTEWSLDPVTGIQTYRKGELQPYAYKDEDVNRMHPVYKPVPINVQPYRPTTCFIQSSEADRFLDGSKTVNKYINHGLMMHYVFEHILTSDDIQRAVNAAVAAGLICGEHERMQIEDCVTQAVNQPETKRWFATGIQVWRECNILTDDGINILRPDRVVMSHDLIEIIDYKFANPSKEHNTQVRNYMHLLKTMYPDKLIKGWLWYVEQHQVTEVKEE